MTDQAPSPSRYVVPILSAANFVIGMGAFMVIGLMNPVADDLGLTAAQAGWLMTAYALGYAVFSPVLVSLTGHIGRRRILALGFAVFGLSALMAAFASTAGLLFAARALAAAGAGLVTPVAASVAAGLSAPDRQARALANVFFGLTIAQVLGVPAGGWIAYTFGWRTAFIVVAVIAVPVLWLIWTRVPAGLSFAPVSLSDLGQTLANLPQMLAVFFTSAFLGSIYVVYTYVSPLMSDTMGYGRDGITVMLLIFGLGAVTGNLAGGFVTDRIGPRRMLAALALIQALLMPAFSALPLPASGLSALFFAWAFFGWSFMAAQQVRLIALEPSRAGVLLALNAAAIYVGAALGSALGGAVVNGIGLQALGIAAGASALFSLALLFLAERLTAAPRKAA